jgi:MFS family permease
VEAEHPTLQVLRLRDVRFLVASRFCSAAAGTLARATIIWQVWDLTGSELQLGLVGLVQFAPVLPISLLGGALADARDRRRVVMLAQAAQGLAVGALALAGEAPLWLVYGLVAALAAASGLEQPSRAALLPTLVPRPLFPSAVALHGTFQNAGWVLGPVLAGFAIEAGGVAAAYAASAGLVAASLASLSGVRAPGAPEERRPVSLAAIREGLRFVRVRPAVLGSMSLDMFAVILASVGALLPVFAEEILHVGARGYGLLAAALELGTVLMALALLAAPPMRRPGRALVAAVAAFGGATVLFGLSRSFPLSFAALVLAGMADQVSMVARASIVQLSTPDALRGRVSSVNQIFVQASNQLGAVESGFLAAATSATFAVVFGGFACLAVLGIIAARVPELRRYRIEAEPVR